MTAQQTLLEVAEKHRLTVDEMKSKRSLRPLVKARAEFIRRACSERNLSDGQIGRILNLTSWTVRYWRHPDARGQKLALYAERRRVNA